MANRTEALSTRIDPKLKYLAELQAREQGVSLSRLVETLLREGLSNGSPHLANEGLWDESAAGRLFHLKNAKPELLTAGEQAILKRAVKMDLLHKSAKVSIANMNAKWDELTKGE
jgi:hypothetical protein